MKSWKLLASVAALIWAPLASANNITFLQTSGTGTVSYDSSTGVLSGSNIPISTDWLISGPTDGSAVFSFTADLDTTGAGGFLFFVGDSATDIQFSITDGGTNLLSGGAATGSLLGLYGSLSLTAQNPTDNDGVYFTSDVINPSVYAADSLEIDFDNVDPLDVTPGGNFEDFTGELEPASFTADVPLPKPLLGGAVLLTAMGFVQLRRSRRSESAA